MEIILCRESTVRGETVTRTGDYSVVYRSVSDYTRIFNQCGLTLKHVERNEPYVLMQMGCDLIKKWKRVVPKPFQALPIVGGLTYWCLRVGTPLIKRLISKAWKYRKSPLPPFVQTGVTREPLTTVFP